MKQHSQKSTSEFYLQSTKANEECACEALDRIMKKVSETDTETPPKAK